MREMVGGCCVCSDDRGWSENPLVYCDGQSCTVAVHQACYGIVAVPTGPWYCRKCESQERSVKVKCELCPSKYGALKRTDNSGWAHVVCALYIPEVRFGNVTTMEPIQLQLVPAERFNKICYICKEKGKHSNATIGACMQCNKGGCKQQFHVTCAQALGLLCEEAGNYLDNVKYCGYCQYHYSKLKKGGNVKPIPPYKPISSIENHLSDSNSEKEMDNSQQQALLQTPSSGVGVVALTNNSITVTLTPPPLTGAASSTPHMHLSANNLGAVMVPKRPSSGKSSSNTNLSKSSSNSVKIHTKTVHSNNTSNNSNSNNNNNSSVTLNSSSSTVEKIPVPSVTVVKCAKNDTSNSSTADYMVAPSGDAKKPSDLSGADQQKSDKDKSTSNVYNNNSNSNNSSTKKRKSSSSSRTPTPNANEASVLVNNTILLAQHETKKIAEEVDSNNGKKLKMDESQSSILLKQPVVALTSLPVVTSSSTSSVNGCGSTSTVLVTAPVTAPTTSTIIVQSTTTSSGVVPQMQYSQAPSGGHHHHNSVVVSNLMGTDLLMHTDRYSGGDNNSTLSSDENDSSGGGLRIVFESQEPSGGGGGPIDMELESPIITPTTITTTTASSLYEPPSKTSGEKGGRGRKRTTPSIQQQHHQLHHYNNGVLAKPSMHYPHHHHQIDGHLVKKSSTLTPPPSSSSTEIKESPPSSPSTSEEVPHHHHHHHHLNNSNNNNNSSSGIMHRNRNSRSKTRKIGPESIISLNTATTGGTTSYHLKDSKTFQNGLPAPHMLGNQLNPNSNMAQKMSDHLNSELEAHSIYNSTEIGVSSHHLVGPQLHHRDIASARASSTSSTSTAASGGSSGLSSMLSGGAANIPQTLDQLLERQWEQGSQFLMEQAQHFDIASLLSCLHQLRAENLRLEEHVSSLLQRRDHLLAVNARLAIPLTGQPTPTTSQPPTNSHAHTVNNIHPQVINSTSTTSNRHSTSGTTPNGYPMQIPLENGLIDGAYTQNRTRSPANSQISPSIRHSPATPSYSTSSSTNSNSLHRPNNSNSGSTESSGTNRGRQQTYPPNVYQQTTGSGPATAQQQQQVLMRRGDTDGHYPNTSKSS